MCTKFQPCICYRCVFMTLFVFFWFFQYYFKPDTIEQKPISNQDVNRNYSNIRIWNSTVCSTRRSSSLIVHWITTVYIVFLWINPQFFGCSVQIFTAKWRHFYDVINPIQEKWRVKVFLRQELILWITAVPKMKVFQPREPYQIAP